MRTLFVAAFVFCWHTWVLAQECGNDATPNQIAKAVEEALQHKEPVAGDKLVVPTAEVAQAVYGKESIERERPFKAVRSGDIWVVYGCMLKNSNLLGGVAVTFIRARTGEVIWITAGQ